VEFALASNSLGKLLFVNIGRSKVARRELCSGRLLRLLR